jgi:Bacterial regulatory protein, arsR family
MDEAPDKPQQQPSVSGEVPKRGVVNAELKGNTLRVYVYALKQGNVGVREVQRALGMSNPSLAQYHLNKLRELGLVTENNGEYAVSNQVKVDVMKDFLKLGTLLVPRFVFYAAFFSAIAVSLFYLGYPYLGLVPIVGWSAGALVVAAAVFWYEAVRAWRSAPEP